MLASISVPPIQAEEGTCIHAQTSELFFLVMPFWADELGGRVRVFELLYRQGEYHLRRHMLLAHALRKKLWKRFPAMMYLSEFELPRHPHLTIRPCKLVGSLLT